jgi:hypothetical protein
MSEIMGLFMGPYQEAFLHYMRFLKLGISLSSIDAGLLTAYLLFL